LIGNQPPTAHFYCVHEFLPMMLRAGGGTIVNINSVAGVRANPRFRRRIHPAKFGLRGLTQTINIEECRNGIRACDIFPAKSNTPL
jgi:NAD(P)-dependent dehydrogenase (short-subunit alcohol dehydrogenase family)